MWIEICQTHGQDSRSSQYWMGNLQKDICGLGGGSHTFKQLPDMIICGQNCGLACEKQFNGRKSKNGPSRNRSSIMRGNWEATTLSIRMMESSTFKKAWRKLEVPVEAAMLCKRGTKKRSSFQETWVKSCDFNNIQKPKHACIVEAHESTRKRLESSLPKDHEDHMAEKGFNSSSHFFLMHEICFHASSEEILDARGSSGQRVGEARKVAGVAIDQSEQ